MLRLIISIYKGINFILKKSDKQKSGIREGRYGVLNDVL